MNFNDDDDPAKQAVMKTRGELVPVFCSKVKLPSCTRHTNNVSAYDDGGHYVSKRRDKLAVLSKVGSNQVARPPKKAAVRRKKAAGAPVRFKSAFIFFSSEKHKEIRVRLGEQGKQEKTTNISKLVSEAWRGLSPDERHKWEVMAQNDRTRYDAEKSTFKGAWHVPKDKAKTSNAPKRPMSAYLAFANCRRGTIKQVMPGASNGDISRALAAMWKEAPEDLRQSYFDEEYKKRQQYKTAMAEWKIKEDEKQRAASPQGGEATATLAAVLDASMEAEACQRMIDKSLKGLQRAGLGSTTTSVSQTNMPSMLTSIDYERQSIPNVAGTMLLSAIGRQSIAPLLGLPESHRRQDPNLQLSGLQYFDIFNAGRYFGAHQPLLVNDSSIDPWAVYYTNGFHRNYGLRTLLASQYRVPRVDSTAISYTAGPSNQDQIAPSFPLGRSTLQELIPRFPYA